MKRRGTLTVTALLGLLLLAPNPPVRADEDDSWIFPNPWSFDSPQSRRRSGGMEFRFLHAKDLDALTMPLISYVTTESRQFVVQVFLPLTVAMPAGGSASFGFGDARISARGSWSFSLDLGTPVGAAWGVGFDINLPWSVFWGHLVSATSGETGVSYSANIAGMIAHPENPIGWVPGFLGFGPRASFALGGQLLFAECAASFPMMMPIAWTDVYAPEVFFSWGVAGGTSPLKEVALLAELSGLVALTGSGAVGGTFVLSQNFFTLSSRFFFGSFEGGLMLRLPLNDQFAVGDAGTSFVVGLYLGGGID